MLVDTRKIQIPRPPVIALFWYIMTAIIFTLIVTHITIVCVTVFLHRAQAHRSLTLHPILSHTMRFWLWLTTGMVTKEWVAIHRKHHRFTDVEGDPHSPVVYGIKQVFFKGVMLYKLAALDKGIIRAYGAGTPDDWLETNIYAPHSKLGIVLMLLTDLALFGWIGLVVWAVQLLWIPLWAAGFINGVGHWFGYRNAETRDQSRNIFPWGIIVGGEELHNNHHIAPASPKLSRTWYEFDIGWMWINVFRVLGLARLKS